MKQLFVLFLIKFSLFGNNTFNLNVSIKGFENNKGKTMIALYDEKGKRIKAIEEKIVNQQVAAVFSGLSVGKYAIRVFHDENSNSKFDTNFIGIPKEKWGVSNNIKPMFSGPKFRDIVFEVNADKAIEIRLN
ncbi:MAG: DUF2141 domain-containing protein [Arcicella sp.]|jgi:uncharacterized protein (DUF2141 family)|nr:DUF2141 domain-containing protein [Arcicella sp.]